MTLFQNLQNPTKFDQTLVKVLFLNMTDKEREQFEQKILATFTENDIIACKEIARTMEFMNERKD